MFTHKKEWTWVLTIIAGIILLFFIVPEITHREIPLCLFKYITGYSCAGCGITRGTIAFWHLDLHNAAYFNLLTIPLNLALIITFGWLLYDIFARKHSYFAFLSKKLPWYGYIIIFVILILNWTRNIYLGI